MIIDYKIPFTSVFFVRRHCSLNPLITDFNLSLTWRFHQNLHWHVLTISHDWILWKIIIENLTYNAVAIRDVINLSHPKFSQVYSLSHPNSIFFFLKINFITDIFDVFLHFTGAQKFFFLIILPTIASYLTFSLKSSFTLHEWIIPISHPQTKNISFYEVETDGETSINWAYRVRLTNSWNCSVIVRASKIQSS